MPELKLVDGVSYGLGLGLPVGTETSILLVASGMSPAIEGFDAPLSVGASLSRGVGDRGFLNGGLAIGLTDSAPTISAQVGWSVRLGSG